jgi:hypothetical protein
MKPLRVFILSIFLLLGLAFTFPVHADMGPKPSLTIVVKNPPAEPYYLDLLIKENGSYDNLGETRGTFDRDMLELLRSEEINGWYPALTSGTKAPLFGELIGIKKGETMVHWFGYYGLPSEFKIIIVSKSGNVRVSETIKTTLFQTTIDYDMANGRFELPNVIVSYVKQFASTFIPTLLIEGLILLLYRLWSRRNLKTILFVNFGTQVFMSAVVGTVLLKQGMLAAFFVLLLIEPVIMIVEALIYRFTLEKGTKNMYLAYAITANLASALVGLMLILLT